MVSHSHSPAPAASASGSSAAPRVAFFGGSFDPPHLGHLAIARAACTALKLDRVLFAPVAAQPLKPRGSSASFADRAAMTRLAIAGESAFELSLLDAPSTALASTSSAPKEPPNYTLETLERLRAQLPASAALFCLIGADSFLTLRRWHRAAEIPFAAALIVAARPGQSLEDLAAALPEDLTLAPDPSSAASSPVLLSPALSRPTELRVFAVRNAVGASAPLFLLPGLHFDLSASEIRSRLRSALHSGPPASDALLPPAVYRYIAEHGLYL